MSVLALYLDSPLQSWGYQSRFDRRTTLSYPTRSGIIGLLAAALGMDRADTAGLATLADLRLSTYAYSGGGRLRDYHTVGGGYDKATQSQQIPRTAEGKTGTTMQTYRDYLQDTRFGVLVEGAESLLAQLDAALRNPRYGVWLGRKSCIPTSPIAQGLHETADQALATLNSLAGDEPYRVITEVDDFSQGTDTLQDTPVDFAARSFAPRRIADNSYPPAD